MSQMMLLGASAPGGLCLGIPCYGAMSPVTAFALAASMRALAREGIAHDLIVFSGNCHVDDSRNAIVREFLKGTCDYLMFIDADLSWSPDDLVRMAKSKRDVIAAIYPHKKDDLTFPVRHLKTEVLQAEDDGALEVEGVPTGFLRISRSVLEKLRETNEPYYEQDSDTTLTHKIFERTIEGTTRFSGDYSFCRKWRALGGKIYIDPEVHFGHLGEKEWRGCYGAHLRDSNKLPLRGVELIKIGRETEHDLRQLHEEWGNGVYVAPVEMLEASITIARGLPAGSSVLEMGTGLTTLCMAAANPAITVHSLEHDPNWLAKITDHISRSGLKNIQIHYAPIYDRWYDTLITPKIKADLVVIDGPPRVIADRLKAFDHVDTSGMMIIDDLTDQVRSVLNSQARDFDEIGRFAIVGRRKETHGLAA